MPMSASIAETYVETVHGARLRLPTAAYHLLAQGGLPMPDSQYQIPSVQTLALRMLVSAFPWSEAARARRRQREASATPPLPVLPGSSVLLPSRGETFVRDSGGDGPTLLLLHGWVVSADLNWIQCYEPLVAAGYRVVALDHQGHGRGIRTPAPFRLLDCAADAAAVVEQLECGPVIAVGYSMGGPITQLLARDHGQLLDGIVLCATAREWQDPELRHAWRTMGVLRVMLGLASPGFWRSLIDIWRMPADESIDWVLAELSRGSPVDIAEAGRELGRFDSRAWLSEIETPAAVLVTSRDRTVLPRRQRELAQQLNAPTVEVAADHFAPGQPESGFADALLAAIAALRAGTPDVKASNRLGAILSGG
jgi:pimeloyl-ACP methyl ester carboxylesterase